MYAQIILLRIFQDEIIHVYKIELILKSSLILANKNKF